VTTDEVPDPDHSLLGRVHELAVLGAFLDRVARDGDALLVTGEPGMGKSVILDAAARRAEAGGALVLRATGVEFEADLAYAGLHQLLLPVLDSLTELPETHRAALAAALGMDGGSTPDALTLTTAILVLLRRLSARSPVVLLVDDLQWVDRQTLLLLNLVARRLRGTGTALILTQRSGLETGFDPTSIETLDLAPLSEPDAHALLRGHHPSLHPSVRQRILADAGGNPLALIELARGLTAAQEVAAEVLPTTLPLSTRLRALFGTRVAALPAASRPLLLLAALKQGQCVELTRMLADASAVLEPAEENGLVVLGTGRHGLTFRHPLIRAAVVDLASAPERRAAHRRLAELTPDPHVRTLHLAEATVGLDDAVADLLDDVAAATLARGDAARAVAVLLRAADLTTTPADQTRRLAAAAYLGANVTGSLAGARALLERARTADPDAADTLQMATAAAAQLLNTDGDVDTAHRMLTRALATAPEDPGSRTTGRHECPSCHQRFESAAGLHHHLEGLVNKAVHTLMLVCAFGGREDLWSDFTEAADRLAPLLSPQLRLAAVTFADPARATAQQLADLDAMVTAADESTDPVEVLEVAIAGEYVDRQPAAALERVVEAGRSGGPATLAAQALVIRAMTAFHEGCWADAAALADEGLALCVQHDLRLLEWGLLNPRMLLAAARGDTEYLAQVRDRMHRWALPRQMLAVRAFTANAEGLAALSQGRFGEAHDSYRTVTEPGTLPPYGQVHMWNVLDVVEAAVRSGNLEHARRHAASAAEALAPISPRLAFQSAAAAALVAPAGAYDAFDRVVDDPDSARWPFHLARVELAYGERLRLDRAMRLARPHLERALELFTALDAPPWVTRAEAALRATGNSRARRGLDGVPALTPQELTVVRLAATGLSNREIAEQLTLSPRTVGAHLHRAFPKLGVTSRAALRDALGPEEGDAPAR
jgi:DNA-binding CsgD family transcriptional regulator